ncbi:MAG: hypothetical protein WCA37_01700 [Terracidiphilus sp.]
MARFVAQFFDAVWSAIEAGTWLPTTRQQFQMMAAALDLDWATMTQLILMCRQAWGIQ